MNGSDREETIFASALALPANQRAAYLDEACAGDAALRRHLEALLEVHDCAGRFMEEPAAPSSRKTVLATAPLSEKAGDRIGGYRLMEQIGEGGCGVVYVAEQKEPIQRRVALKILKLGMDTREVTARFEAERQALALMDHPNIAKVFDAGATDTGRPYFVMELVRGTKITDYCDQNKLPTADRLELFMQVCRAIQHAHQKGIIHRDIKPSNVLVASHDGAPVPKVIDFGIAKATQGRLTDRTVYTAFEQFMGTPAYMSPEQAGLSSLDIDTRSDVYSLGVLLYELLTGKTPFEAGILLKAGLEEMRRTIREKEPPKPSTRLSTMLQADLTTIARHRGADPPKLVHLVRGDLDWIVMKCLEKERNRRYDTATGLASDVQRHLQNEPVNARPPSGWYRLQKTVRRHKGTFAAIASIVVVLVLGVAVSTWQAVRATRAVREQSRLRNQAEVAQVNESKLRQQAEANEKKAQSQTALSEQVGEFLTDMLKSVGPSKALGRDTTMMREILDQTSKRLGPELGKYPQGVAQLRNTLGEVYHALGDYRNAEAMFRQALETRRKMLGEEHEDVAETMNNLGATLESLGNYEGEVETLYRQALAIRRKLLGNEHRQVAQSLNNLANVLMHQGKLADAERLHREALDMRRKLLGNEHREVATSLHNMGNILSMEGRPDEAEPFARQAVELRKREGPATPQLATSMHNLANVLLNQGKAAEAESIYRDVLEMRQKLLKEHPDVAWSLQVLAQALKRQNKLAEAETHYRQALEMRRKLLENGHPSVAQSVDDLASVLLNEGKLAEAERLYRELLEMQRKRRGNEHPDVARSLDKVALALELQEKLADAESLYREALAIRRTLLGDEHHPDVATSLSYVGRTVANQARSSEAEPLLRQALAIRRERLGSNHVDTRTSIMTLAHELAHQRLWAEAESLLVEVIALERTGGRGVSVLDSLDLLAAVRIEQGKFTEAESAAREGLARRGKVLPEDWRIFHTRSLLGRSLLGQKNYTDAEPLLLSGYEGLVQHEDKIPADYKKRLKEALERVVQFYEATGSSNEAARWKAEATRRYRKRADELRAAAATGTVQALNSLAWFLATCPDSQVRDGPAAVAVAEKAVAATHRKKANNLDTLAAAYAAAGQFPKAVSAQQEAIALLGSHDEGYASRLKLYRAGSPCFADEE